MDILNTVSLESNTQIIINFDGGDLSSDAGLLLFTEFLFKIGAVKLIFHYSNSQISLCHYHFCTGIMVLSGFICVPLS